MTLLDKARKLTETLKRSVIALAGVLYRINEENAYKANFDSFTAYVEDDLGLNRGFASKLLTIHEHYVLGGGVAPSQLQEVGHERLYMAIKLPGTPKEQLSKALTLTKGELRTEVRDPNDTCAHEQTITICSKCGRRV